MTTSGPDEQDLLNALDPKYRVDLDPDDVDACVAREPAARLLGLMRVFGAIDRRVGALEAERDAVLDAYTSRLASRRLFLLGLARSIERAHTCAWRDSAVTKTLSHGGARSSLRATKDAVEIVDVEAALAWAQEHFPAGVRVVEMVAVGEWKQEALRRLQETGELPPGAEVRPGGLAHSVRRA